VQSKLDSVPSETPSAPSQPALRTSGSKRFGKKLYAVAAIVAVAVIAVALLVPQGAATIPLGVEYTVGEKMVYNTIETVTTQTANSSLPPEGPWETSINSTEIVEVTDFDGEYYSLNHTITAKLGNTPVSVSYIEKMNKTGYTGYFRLEGTEEVLVSNMSTDPFASVLLDKPEVKVGDTWQVPVNSGNSNVSVTGEMTITFGGIQNITVPAGTYEVFKVDTVSNLTMSIKYPTSGNYTNPPFKINMVISGQTYIEYGTCRRIESTTQTIQRPAQATGTSTTISISAKTTLVQHIKPAEHQKRIHDSRRPL
jgi:hypothetical protein